jgi:hypothetical protein
MHDSHSTNDVSKADEAANEPRRIDLVERWMQAVITHPGGVAAGIDSEAANAQIPLAAADIEQVIEPSKSLGSIERLGVYANAYYARLLECLREVFPVVNQTMGEAIFNHFALSYLQKYPSQSYTLGKLGERFAQFLEETRPSEPDATANNVAAAADAGLAADWPRFVVDLATLEWTVGEVYDGPGMEKRPALSADDLAKIPTDQWPRAKIELAPCVRLLQFRFPVNDYYARMRELARDDDEDDLARTQGDARDDQEIAIPEPEVTFLALSRRDYVVWRYPLSRAQFALLSALSRGETVETAIAAASAASELGDDERGDDEFAAALHRWFANWTEDQFFAGVSVD